MTYLRYHTTLDNVAISYTYSPGRPATYDDPPESAEIEVQCVWLLDESDRRIFDILPLLDKPPGSFEALFGKWITERLAEHAEEYVADMRAEAAEYRRESKE